MTQNAAVKMDLVVHRGACHCGAVQFEVQAPPHVVAWDCNCSICHMKRNLHFVVPLARYASALSPLRWTSGGSRVPERSPPADH